MKYVCPICGSENIIPLFAKDNIWECQDCGYRGAPQVIASHLEEMWKSYKKIANSNKAKR